LDTIEIFGIERGMWASDFPVARLRVSYKNQLGGMLAIMNDLSGSGVHQVFNKNAMNFYKSNLP
jgi:predicted TIM-barrel fold metal-dependent hydrolase